MFLTMMLLLLAGCGSGTRVTTSGNFSGRTLAQSNSTAGTLDDVTELADVKLSAAAVVGGSPVEITVGLTKPAPVGGAVVELTSSDASIVRTPEKVTIPAGVTTAKIVAMTAAVNATSSIGITALYNGVVKGTSLSVSTTTTPPFSVVLQPTTLTIGDGLGGTDKVITRVSAGYSHALRLWLSHVPAGVSATLTPTLIPAPGSGSAKLAVHVGSGVVPASYHMLVNTSNGTITQSVRLTLKVAPNPGATFRGCWYQQNGLRYQAVQISVANPGTYPFDAVLYHGATCDPNNWADEFGYGTPLGFGIGWLFWFTDFADQTNTSAIWHVGVDKSQCVNYAVAPTC